MSDNEIRHFLVTRNVSRRKTTVVEFDTDYDAAQHAYQAAEQRARGRRYAAYARPRIELFDVLDSPSTRLFFNECHCRIGFLTPREAA